MGLNLFPRGSVGTQVQSFVLFMESEPPAVQNGLSGLGLEPSLVDRLETDLPKDLSRRRPDPSAGDLTAVAAENQELRAELDKLRVERAAFVETQRRIMELLGTQSPARILHDLRNVLNERDLFKTLANLQAEEQ